MNTDQSYYKNTRPEVLPFIPDAYSKVLEIGCGAGDFRCNLHKKCEYWGIEPVPHIAETALNILDKVLTGTFDEAFDQLPNNYFDLIICNDVIEHMPDHNIFFQSVQKKLSEEGCIVGSIPNVRYVKNLIDILFKKDWEYKDAGILDRTHLRFFTEKSLKRSIQENGFVIDKFGGINNQLKSLFSIDGIYRRIKYLPMLLVLGADIKYMQFGIRIKIKKHDPTAIL